MLPKLTLKYLVASLAITGFFAVFLLAESRPSPTVNQSSRVVPAVLDADYDWTNMTQPVVTVQHSKYNLKYNTWYNNGGYPTDYGNPYHSYNYWTERYRRQSYRFLKPGPVRRNFTLVYPYGYYPMLPPPYSPYSYDGYGQYRQYTQPEQQPQIPPKTQEQIEEEMRIEVARHIDYISQAFVSGDYSKAVIRAQQALKQMPDNTKLRFICAQAYFADSRFPNAAITVRSTLETMAQTGQQEVFYPMSLYPNQTILNQQIDRLMVAINIKPYDASLKLLLGYELLGVGRVDDALSYLQKASQDAVNETASLYLAKVSGNIYRHIEPKASPKSSEPNEPNISVKKPMTAEPNY
jgi:tetratricopeptide (TPR) repeat protein